MRYLITGAQGFVGRYLTAAILQQEASAQILGVGRSARISGRFSHTLSAGGTILATLPQRLLSVEDERFSYRRLNILDQSKMLETLKDFRPSVIFHLASGLRNDPIGDLIATNIQGTTALMLAVAEAGLPTPKVILGSTGGVYGRIDPANLPLSEACPCDPIDMYSITKLVAEQIARLLGRMHDVHVVTARIFNIVGPGQSERHVCGQFVARLFALQASSGKNFVVGDVESTRDFVDVRDVAAALMVVARDGLPDSVYNLASGIETPISRVLEILIHACNFEGEWSSERPMSRRDDVPRHWANVAALQSLGFVQRYSLEDSLNDLLTYYRELARA